MMQQNNSGMTPGSNLNLKPPSPLSFEGNVSENWIKWYKKFKIYMLATENIDKPDNIKVAILLHIGEEALEKFEIFELSEDQQQNFNSVVKAFENYCIPKKNESVCRHLFFQRSQRSEENFDDFLTELKRLSIDCAFGELRDSLIKDRIVSIQRYTKQTVEGSPVKRGRSDVGQSNAPMQSSEVGKSTNGEIKTNGSSQRDTEKK